MANINNIILGLVLSSSLSKMRKVWFWPVERLLNFGVNLYCGSEQLHV